MGMGIDMEYIKLFVRCVLMIKPVIKPMIKEAINNVTKQRQEDLN